MHSLHCPGEMLMPNCRPFPIQHDQGFQVKTRSTWQNKPCWLPHWWINRSSSHLDLHTIASNLVNSISQWTEREDTSTDKEESNQNNATNKALPNGLSAERKIFNCMQEDECVHGGGSVLNEPSSRLWAQIQPVGELGKRLHVGLHIWRITDREGRSQASQGFHGKGNLKP